MTLSMYTFEDADGNEEGFTTMDYREAKEYAQENRVKVICNEFEWADSFPLDDFTEKKPGRPRRKAKPPENPLVRELTKELDKARPKGKKK